jgi:hypothetical protein
MLLGYAGATYRGANRGSAPPDKTRHPVASGLQPTHQPGCANAVVAIATPAPSASNAFVNLIIVSSSLSDDERRKADLAKHSSNSMLTP